MNVCVESNKDILNIFSMLLNILLSQNNENDNLLAKLKAYEEDLKVSALEKSILDLENTYLVSSIKSHEALVNATVKDLCSQVGYDFNQFNKLNVSENLNHRLISIKSFFQDINTIKSIINRFISDKEKEIYEINSRLVEFLKDKNSILIQGGNQSTFANNSDDNSAKLLSIKDKEILSLSNEINSLKLLSQKKSLDKKINHANNSSLLIF